MDGHEAGLANQPRGLDGSLGKTQVADGDAAGFFCVVDDVDLGVAVTVFGEGPRRHPMAGGAAVVAQGPDHAGAGVGRFVIPGLDLQAQVGDIIGDADGDAAAWLGQIQLGEDCHGHGRREFLRRQAVAAAHQTQAATGLGEGGGDLGKKRFTEGPWFLGAVEDGELGGGGRQQGQQGRCRKRPVESQGQDADALSGGHQAIDGRPHRHRPRAQDYHHPIGLGVPVVLDGAVAAAREVGEAVADLLDHAFAAIVPGIGGFAGLEIKIGLLGRAAQGWSFRGQTPGAVGGDGVFGHQRPQVGVGEAVDGR